MTGIIPINKNKDITSFGVVAKMRGITKEKKAGHAGTLDPMATGVLPILFGGATRFLDLLPDHNKGYIAKLKLGLTTDTLDITGKVLTESKVVTTLNDFQSVMPNFVGEISQIPPMYSAISKDGVRLYDLARKGIEVERESRKVTVKNLELVDYDEINNEFTISVLCSKGTYIRTICDDIGSALGCGAVMTELERTLAAGFDLKQSITLEQAQEIKDNTGDFSSHLISVEQALIVYDEVHISAPQSNRFSNGGALDLQRIRQEISDDIYRVYSPDGLFLGLGEGDVQGGQLLVKKLLVRRD